jgi:hypothetical protein
LPLQLRLCRHRSLCLPCQPLLHQLGARRLQHLDRAVRRRFLSLHQWTATAHTRVIQRVSGVLMRHLPAAQPLSQAPPRVPPRVVRLHPLLVRQHLLPQSVARWLLLSRLLLRVGLLSPRRLLSLD